MRRRASSPWRKAGSHIRTRPSPGVPRPDAAGGLWSQLGGAPQAGAGVVVGVLDTGIWPESTAFAGGTGIPVPADWHGKCVAGESVPGHDLQRQARRRAVLRRGLREAATSSRPSTCRRETVTVTGRTQRPPPRPQRHRRHDRRPHRSGRLGHGPGRQGRGVQGLLGREARRCGRLLQLRQRRGDQRTRCRRRRRDQLLDRRRLRVRRRSTRWRRPSGARRTPVCSSRTRPATAARVQHARPPVPVGDHGGGRDLPPCLPGGRARQRRPLRRCLHDRVRCTTPKPLVTVSERQARERVRIGRGKLCFAGTLDPAKAAGKIVLCDRGVNDRIDKGFEVKRAGGVGMVMANTQPELAER